MPDPRTPSEKIHQTANAARGSSEAELVGAATKISTEGVEVTWKYSGDPDLGQATFGLIAPGKVFNAKFDFTELMSMTIFDLHTSQNRTVDLVYEYTSEAFSVFLPYDVMGIDNQTVTLELIVNSIRRGSMKLTI